MQMTREADYAIRIMHCIVVTNNRVDAQSIADHANVSIRFTLKILRKLVSAGFVKSFKGAKGGYVLAKNPNEISIIQVIEAVTESYAFNRCLNPGFDCPRNGENQCPYHHVFDSVTQSVKKELGLVTFGSVINR